MNVFEVPTGTCTRVVVDDGQIRYGIATDDRVFFNGKYQRVFIGFGPDEGIIFGAGIDHCDYDEIKAASAYRKQDVGSKTDA